MAKLVKLGDMKIGDYFKHEDLQGKQRMCVKIDPCNTEDEITVTAIDLRTGESLVFKDFDEFKPVKLEIVETSIGLHEKLDKIMVALVKIV